MKLMISPRMIVEHDMREESLGSRYNYPLNRLNQGELTSFVHIRITSYYYSCFFIDEPNILYISSYQRNGKNKPTNFGILKITPHQFPLETGKSQDPVSERDLKRKVEAES